MTAHNAIPIYICSKGRASKPKTADLLAAASLPFVVVVEPQDYDEYEAFRPEYRYQVMDTNDGGYVHVCNYIHAAAIAAVAVDGAPPWFWMLDDDIDAFYTAGDGKCTKCDAATAIRGAEEYFVENDSIAQASLEFQQYAWSATKSWVLNTACRAAVCTHAPRTRRLHRRPEVDLKADTDFSLQVLASGYHTARITRYAFGTGKYGRSVGGNDFAYAAPQAEERCVEALCRLWPGIVAPVTKKDGRIDAKVNWAAVAPR
jgi:hypothetical protein